MYLLFTQSDPNIHRFLNGLWGGFKVIPVVAWNHLTRIDNNAIFNLSYILGMMLFGALFLLVVSGLRRN